MSTTPPEPDPQPQPDTQPHEVPDQQGGRLSEEDRREDYDDEERPTE